MRLLRAPDAKRVEQLQREGVRACLRVPFARR